MKQRLRAIARNTALKKSASSLALAALCCFGGTLHAAAPAGGGSRLYCCQDSSGKQVCGDILPQVCYGRAYREIGADGRTVREVDAPLTAEQRAQKVAEDAKRKEEEARQKEQQRKDQALMDTYANVEDIESLRKRSIEEIHKSIKNAETRIVEIRALRKKFENEAEFYKKKTLPPDVRKGLADTDSDIGVQEAFIADKKKELATVRARYDENKRRFIDLMTQRAPKR